MVIFRLELEKTIVMLNFITFSLSKCNISCKKNFFKCRTKIFLFGYFWAGTRKSYCTVVFLNQHPQNIEFEISILEFVNMQSFIQKQKTFKLGTKNTFGIFGLQLNKNYYQNFNQHTRICETIKFHPKRKTINLGLKMLYLGL